MSFVVAGYTLSRMYRSGRGRMRLLRRWKSHWRCGADGERPMTWFNAVRRRLKGRAAVCEGGWTIPTKEILS